MSTRICHRCRQPFSGDNPPSAEVEVLPRPAGGARAYGALCAACAVAGLRSSVAAPQAAPAPVAHLPPPAPLTAPLAAALATDRAPRVKSVGEVFKLMSGGVPLSIMAARAAAELRRIQPAPAPPPAPRHALPRVQCAACRHCPSGYAPCPAGRWAPNAHWRKCEHYEPR